jgi:nicotinate-nucleotide adenylyltransferase
VYVPAAKSPLKPGGPVAADADRIAMLGRALAGQERVAIWEEEIERARRDVRPSYWVDTLERAATLLAPGAALFFLIGADQAAQFHRWREFRRILELARPVVLLRPPIDTPAMLERALRLATDDSGHPVWSGEAIEFWLSALVPLPLRADNSTALRELLPRRAEAEVKAQLEAVLPAPVLAYILERPALYSR